MVLGWRKAFCTTISKKQEQNTPIIREKKHEKSPSPSPSPKLSSRLTGLFSNSTTPRSSSLRCRTVATQTSELIQSNSAPQSPTLKCKTRSGSRFFQNVASSPVSSPRSPSSFSLFKSRKSRCGVCYQSVKPGQGTAVFTAECGHNFHYPCISSHVLHTCPICNYTWKQQIHLLNNTHQPLSRKSNLGDNADKRNVVLKVYNDDEPLTLPVTGSPFNSIPESDEYDEFPGFSVQTEPKARTMDISILPDTAVVSVSKVTETYAVVLRINAPASLLRKAPIDLVVVLNVNRNVITAEKMVFLKKAMRAVVSALSVNDRLSIVAYSSTSKRLFPLRRMTVAGKRAARKIIDAIAAVDGGGVVASAGDSLKKAVKVLEDRREVNSASGILLFSDGVDNRVVSSTRLSEVSVHCVSLRACVNAPADDIISKCISPLLNVVIQDLRIRVGFEYGSGYGEISAVYTCGNGPAFLGSGSSWCQVGDLYSEEKRELLLELKVPLTCTGPRNKVTIQYSYNDPSTQQPVFDEEWSLSVPTPRAVGSSFTYETQRLRCLFVTTRAVVESRRMRERGDLSGAQRMLGSARALVMQSGSGLGEEFVLGLEAELADLNRRRQDQLPRVQVRSRSQREKEADPLTPTSAWRAAERLAKVAMMRKSLNRVSDLHGFENARF